MSAPQSNQRGIETRLARRFPVRTGVRLNRTSVGLKPGYARQAVTWTVDSLNRTSVGLKPYVVANPALPLRVASIEPAWD